MHRLLPGPNADGGGRSRAQVIAGICLAVWLINIPRFNDPLHGGWVRLSAMHLSAMLRTSSVTTF